MATDNVSLSVDPREVTGKKVRALRRTGITPIHLYGGGGESLTLQAETQALRAAVNTAGRGQPIALEVGGGEKALTFVREIAKHPVTGELQHVDFIRVDASVPVSAEVTLTMVGEAPATRGGGGQFLRGIRTVTVSVLPLEVPEEIEVSIEGLENIGDNIRVEDLILPDGVVAISSPDQVVARIAMTRTAAVEVGEGMEVEEGEEAEEGEEVAEGEESPRPLDMHNIGRSVQFSSNKKASRRGVRFYVRVSEIKRECTNALKMSPRIHPAPHRALLESYGRDQ